MMVGWMAAVFVATTLVSTPFVRWYWNPVVVMALLRDRLCASCGYPLAANGTGDDGCTVCPECGAAWKLPEAAAVIEAKS